MAEAVLFSVAGGILKSLAGEIFKPGGSYASKKIQLLCCAKGEFQSLQVTIDIIRAGLLDAEKKQWRDGQIKEWLRGLKDVLYDVQDLIDDVTTQDLRRQVTSGNKMWKEVRIFFSKSNQLAHRWEVANKIQGLAKKLDQIKVANEFRFDTHLSEETVPIVRERTGPFPGREEIIGREADQTKIITRLFDPSSEERVSVVFILGIGGLGKTTLARLVFNEVKVTSVEAADTFQLKMWAWCHGDSKIFDVDAIIKEMLQSARDECRCQWDAVMMTDPQGIENKSPHQLQELLVKVLDRKKYLLVLDDLWNEDRGSWMKLQCLLMVGSMGSKILITTRNQSVVNIIDKKPDIHDLSGLSEHESWDLLKKRAFQEPQESVDPRLEEIGREIVQKCGYVPLAVKTIGDLLFNKNQDGWLYYKDHEFSQIADLDQRIMEVLKLNYDALQSRLKHCFAYCALFPKGHVFDRRTMIQLWMAQGFIEPSDKNKDLEETGDDYVSYLLHRSLLEACEHNDCNGEVKKFKMHYLMHDIALRVAGDESKILEFNKGGNRKRIRHASFASQLSSLQEATSQLEATIVRTFLSLKSGTSAQILSANEYHEIFSKFRHCRTLGLGYADFCIPSSVGSQLKHLRFLDVSENQSIQSLPDSITDLLNLQTLKLSGCKKLTTLPRDFRKLVNLRHLLIDGCDSLSHMPCGLNHLSSLQTLSHFIVQKVDRKVPGGVGRVDELSELDKLAGSITIRNLEFLRPTPEQGHLSGKQHLRSLELKWSWAHQDDKSENDESIVWDNLKPHPNLTHLTISSYMGRTPPSWLSSIEKLVELKLDDCGAWEYLPTMSGLKFLRTLTLQELDALELVQEISDLEQSTTPRPFFPSLERLVLLNCRNLKGWWGRRQSMGADQDHWQYNSQSSFPKLSRVEILGCPHLNSMPLFPLIKHLRLDGVSAKLLEQHVPKCPSEESTFIPLSKLEDLRLSGVDMEHKMLKDLLPCLTNLEFMGLYGCNELRSLACGMQHLSSLQHLEFCACAELNLSIHGDEHGTQWRFLTKLRGLRIEELPNLKALPEGIQHVTTLQSLEVEGCENLTNLPEWIGNFSSLKELQINGCPGLECLPDGMRRLTSLKKLRIAGCPTLEKRCQRISGVDWEKIQRVPYKTFK